MSRWEGIAAKLAEVGIKVTMGKSRRIDEPEWRVPMTFRWDLSRDDEDWRHGLDLFLNAPEEGSPDATVGETLIAAAHMAQMMARWLKRWALEGPRTRDDALKVGDFRVFFPAEPEPEDGTIMARVVWQAPGERDPHGEAVWVAVSFPWAEGAAWDELARAAVKRAKVMAEALSAAA